MLSSTLSSIPFMSSETGAQVDAAGLLTYLLVPLLSFLWRLALYIPGVDLVYQSLSVIFPYISKILNIIGTPNLFNRISVIRLPTEVMASVPSDNALYPRTSTHRSVSDAFCPSKGSWLVHHTLTRSFASDSTSRFVHRRFHTFPQCESHIHSSQRTSTMTALSPLLETETTISTHWNEQESVGMKTLSIGSESVYTQCLPSKSNVRVECRIGSSTIIVPEGAITEFDISDKSAMDDPTDYLQPLSWSSECNVEDSEDLPSVNDLINFFATMDARNRSTKPGLLKGNDQKFQSEHCNSHTESDMVIDEERCYDCDSMGYSVVSTYRDADVHHPYFSPIDKGLLPAEISGNSIDPPSGIPANSKTLRDILGERWSESTYFSGPIVCFDGISTPLARADKRSPAPERSSNLSTN